MIWLIAAAKFIAKHWRYAVLLAFLAAVAWSQWYLYHKGQESGRSALLAEQADARAKAAEEALTQAKANQAKAEQMAQDFVDLAKGFLQEKTNAKTQADAVVADLRAGNLKLRQQWQTCLSSPGKASTSAGGANDATDLRQADLGRVYGIAQQCDAHVTALQELLRLERK